MKECNLCNRLGNVHYRVKSINYKNWIFCCKNCLILISRENKYTYGGTRKVKKKI